MKKLLDVQYALMCLQYLDGKSDRHSTVDEISHAQGVPMAECTTLLKHLNAAGLVDLDNEGRYSLPRPLSEYRALEILAAIRWPVKTLTRFRMLFGPHRGLVTRKTLEAVSRADLSGLRPADNVGM